MDPEMEALVASGDVWVDKQAPADPVSNPLVMPLWDVAR